MKQALRDTTAPEAWIRRQACAFWGDLDGLMFWAEVLDVPTSVMLRHAEAVLQSAAPERPPCQLALFGREA